MRDLARLIVWMVADLFRSRAALEAEIWMLRQQINVLRRMAPKKQTVSCIDRLIFVCLYRLLPNARDALAIVKPDTIVRWHRAGFRSYWRWKSRPRAGRPTVPLEIRRLIREMSIANPLWGAPRIHGELLNLGIDIGQTSVAKYMAKPRRPPSQGWKTFLNNHADGIAAMDLFVVPTISFRRTHSAKTPPVAIERGSPRSRCGGFWLLACLPVPRKKVDHFIDWMIRQPGQYVGKPGLRIDVVHLASFDKCIDGGGTMAASI